MAFTNDYLLRQIELMANGFAQLVLERQVHPTDTMDEFGQCALDDLLLLRLRALVAKGRIGAAEDALFAAAEAGDAALFGPVAAEFYRDLTALSDEALAQGGFSRAEIAQGLNDFAALCRE